MHLFWRTLKEGNNYENKANKSYVMTKTKYKRVWKEPAVSNKDEPLYAEIFRTQAVWYDKKHPDYIDKHLQDCLIFPIKKKEIEFKDRANITKLHSKSDNLETT